MQSDSKSLAESMKAIVELWKGKLQNQKTLKEEWEQFMANSKRLIQETTTTIEETIFPRAPVNTEKYSEVIKFYENKLEEIQPMLKVRFVKTALKFY
jgi:hypothetical protein